MPHPVLLRCTCALSALALLAPAAADAKPKKKRLAEALYTVIARAEMHEQWQFLERSEIECEGGTCAAETKGSGSASMQLKGKPTTWLVMRGPNGRPPMLNVGTGEGIPLKGPYLRDGELSTIHTGSWADANPPEIFPTSDCGNKPLTLDFNLAFQGRNRIAPVALPDDLRENCPTGPPTGLDFPDGDDVPAITEVATQVDPGKFLSTKQFTIRGSRTWKAGVQPPQGAYVARSGEKVITWDWSVTFQMQKKGRQYY